AKLRRLFPDVGFQCLDQLDQGERIGIQVFREGRAFGDLAWFDLEDVAEAVLDQRDNLLAAVWTFGCSRHGAETTASGRRRQPDGAPIRRRLGPNPGPRRWRW